MSEEGIDRIIAHIETEADRESSEIISKACEEADKVLQSAQEKADREAEKILLEGEKAADLEGQRIIAETRINVRRQKMDAQEEAITKSFEEAKRNLEELVKTGRWDNFVYMDVLFNLILSASEVVAGAKLELVLNQKDREVFDQVEVKKLNERLQKKIGRGVSLVVTDNSAHFLGGVIVKDLEKSVEVDNTLETKLNRLKESIRVDVAKTLFRDKL